MYAATDIVISRFPLISREDLGNMPPPDWLICGVLPTKSLSILYGPSGVGKTFLALDIALSISSGIEWQGKVCKEGHVIYIAGEGVSGVNDRISAWEINSGIKSSKINFIANAPQLTQTKDFNDFVSSIIESRIDVDLIIIDTLARSAVGIEENSAKEVGEFISKVDELKNRFSCTVLIIHHSGKQRSNNQSATERGSSALRGACDTIISVNKKNQGVEIKCEKQKDAEEFTKINLSLKQVIIEDERTSCIYVSKHNSILDVNEDIQHTLSDNAKKVLIAFNSSTTSPYRSKDLIKSSKVANASFYREINNLFDEGFINRVGNGLYELTEQGRSAVPTLMGVSKDSQIVTLNSQHSHTP